MDGYGNDIRRQLGEARTLRERVFGELENLRERENVDGADEGLQERVANLNRAVAKADDRIAELEGELGRLYEREAYARRIMDDPRHREDGTPPPREQAESRGGRGEARDAALRTVERYAERMDAEAAERVERLVRSDEPRDLTARYLAAVGADAYASAFAKVLADPQFAHLRFSPQEVEAVRTASAVEAERAMSIGDNPSGGFAVPFALDPSIMLSSAGASNPVRRLARNVTTTTNEWRGISSDGVTVSYKAEAAVMTDGTPVLSQPVIHCARWDGFVPYSWELAMDFQQLENELVRLIADGRDTLEATKFWNGSGTNEPSGLISGLAAAQGVWTVGTATLAAGDLWSLKAGISARFAAQTTFAAPSPLFDRIYRLVPNASTVEPALMESRSGPLMGRPIAEWSFSAGTSTATGNTIAVAGDFNAGYVIADRLGLTAVPVPVLFSGNTAGAIGYPTGQSGLVVWGRTGAGVVNANAFRALVAR